MDDSAKWRQIRVSVNDDVTLTLGEFIDGWATHVRKFVAEQEASREEQSVWGAHDYVGAIHLRDAVARGLDKLAPALRSDADSSVDAADRLLIDITNSDERGVVRAFAGADTTHAGWWWSRLPRHGPIRADLDDWRQQFS